MEGADGGLVEWFIRANQGHSLKRLDKVELTPVQDASQIPLVIHGTNTNAWHSIQKQGLCRMNRLHIHFASGLLSDPSVKSGMRHSANVFIYIDAVKAMADGIGLYTSANGVILSEGVGEQGTIAPKYFIKVTDRDGNPLALDGTDGDDRIHSSTS